MSDDKRGNLLADILAPAKAHDALRADFHAALDDLLDAAAEDGGNLCVPAFWMFVASLAEGKGVAEDLQRAGAQMLAANRPDLLDRPNDNSKDAQVLFQAAQFSMLFHLLGRLSAIPGAILPDSFMASAFRGIAANLVNPGPGKYPDLLGLGSTRGDEILRRDARQKLVQVVYYRAARDGISVAAARESVFPLRGRGENFPRTWQGWQREVAEAYGVSVRQIGTKAQAAARGEIDSTDFDLDSDTVARVWKLARDRKKPK